MYNDHISFHSDRDYRPIVGSGSVAFTTSDANTSKTITTMDDGSDFVIFIESSGYRFIANSNNGYKPFIASNTLKVYIDTSASGTIYWRKYGD